MRSRSAFLLLARRIDSMPPVLTEAILFLSVVEVGYRYRKEPGSGRSILFEGMIDSNQVADVETGPQSWETGDWASGCPGCDEPALSDS